MAQRISLIEARSVAKQNAASRWAGRNGYNRIEPECWPLWQPKFPLRPGAKVFTIGSCFARNIEHHLKERGFDIPMLNIPALSEGQMNTSHCNKYSPAAIYQELAWTRAIMDRDDTVHETDVTPLLVETSPGRFLDLHLSDAKLTDFATAMQRRRVVYAIFREAFTSDVVVITLGLIEAAFDTRSNLYVQLTPGLFDAYHAGQFEFERLSFSDCRSFTAATIDMLTAGSARNILLTTSPVPLRRTFTPDDVIIANMQSKSVLRAVAGEITAAYDCVDYFPSYESVMLTRQGYVWDDDLVHVASSFVARIINRVIDAHAVGNSAAPTDAELKFCGLIAEDDLAAARAIIPQLDLDRQRPGNAQLDLAAALYWKAEDRRDAAVKHARRAARAEVPFVRDIFIRLAEVLYWADLPEEAERFVLNLMNSADELSREHYLVQGRGFLPAELICRVHDRYLQFELHNVATVVCCANALSAMGRGADAMKRIEQAIAVRPDHVPLRRRYATLLAAEGQCARAIEVLRELVETNPSDPALRQMLARQLTDLGRIDEAADQLAAAVHLAPDDPKLQIRYARLLQRLGRGADALAAMTAAQRMDPANTTLPSAIARLQAKQTSAR